jgi:hypothetical protein
MRILIACLLIACVTGCTPRPTATDQAAIRQRLNAFERAWRAGDSTGVRDSLAANSPQAGDFVATQFQALAARQRLQKAFDSVWQKSPWNAFPPPSASRLVPIDLDTYATRVAKVDAAKMVLKPDGGVQVMNASEHELFLMRKDQPEDWRIDPETFGDIARKTEWARGDVATADELIAAIGNGSSQDFQRVMYHQTAVLARRALENPP